MLTCKKREQQAVSTLLVGAPKTGLLLYRSILSWQIRHCTHSIDVTALQSLHAGPTGAPAAVDLAHKAVVMRCLEALCDNGQLLVDVFVNYDCDLEGANLFERLVLALVRIAQGTQDKEAQASASQEELAMRLSVRSLC